MNKIFDTLCLGSGGHIGFAFHAALSHLEDNNIIDMNNIQNFVGCSAGSVSAFILNLGYTNKDMIEFIKIFIFL